MITSSSPPPTRLLRPRWAPLAPLRDGGRGLAGTLAPGRYGHPGAAPAAAARASLDTVGGRLNGAGLPRLRA
ncbi:MAG: hypothetical protein M3N53_15115, partial [Actinomycetota bacterium]|nr:hypothetical protein [Actinomycetota bacterium]